MVAVSSWKPNDRITMTANSAPLDHPMRLVASVAPALGAAWAEMCSEDEPVDDIWLHLAFALLARRQDGVLPDLAVVSPLIEDFLDPYDDQDQISLGLIHALLLQAENYGLDWARAREALGPKARRVWDSLRR